MTLRFSTLLVLSVLLISSININAQTDTGDPKGYTFSYGEIRHTGRNLYIKSIPEYQEHTAIATAIMVYGLASLDHKLSREGYYVDQ